MSKLLLAQTVSVSHCQIHNNARKQTSFEESKEAAYYYKARKILGKAREGTDQSPAYNQERKIVSGVKVFDNPTGFVVSVVIQPRRIISYLEGTSMQM